MKAALLLLVSLSVCKADTYYFNTSAPPKNAENSTWPINGGTTAVSQPIQVPSGALFELLNVQEPDGLAVTTRAFVQSDIGSFVLYMTSPTQKPASSNLPPGTVLAGPATIRLEGLDTSAPTFYTYSIKTTQDSSNSNAAVVPDDNSGDHQVILEASSDLKTWEPVQPGSYPTTTARRFFRVRVQKQ